MPRKLHKRMRSFNVTVREKIKKRDDNKCQFNEMFGISELSGVECSEELSVHHRIYKRASYEKVEDGITVCTRCHALVEIAIRKAGKKEEAKKEKEAEDLQDKKQ